MPGAPRPPAVAPGNLLPAGVLFDERPRKKSEKSTRFLTRTSPSPRKPEIAFPSSEPATCPPSPGNDVKDVRSALFAPPKEVTENERRLALSVSEQLEDHQVTIKVLLQNSQAELLARFDAMFAEQRERAEAVSLKLQRQEERLEEGMDRLLQQKSTAGALSGVGPGMGGCKEQSSQQIEELTCKLQDKSEERLNKFQSTQEQSINQIKQLLMSHPLFRIVEERCKKYGNGDVMQHSSTPVGYRSTMLRNSTAPRSSQLPQNPPSEPKLMDSHAITEECDGTPSDHLVPLSPMNHHIRDARERLRKIKKQVRGITPKMALDGASSFMIVANCIWMGFDIHLYSPDKESHHVRFVDVFFTVCFILELALRFLMQGTDFFMHPHLRMNAMDSIIIACQVADLFVTLFTISWLRSIRVVRLLKALKMLRSFENVRHLRLLVAAVAGSLQSLFWISTFLSFVLYVFSLVLMQLVQSQINDETMLTDEILLYYGTVRHCMTTLFKSISGGAPWSTLVQPLSEISDFNTFIFMCIWTFLVIGCMNMFTAIFVEGMRVIVQRDGSMHAIEFIRTHKKDAPVNKMRKSLSSMTKDKDGKDGPGTISPDMLEKFRQNDEYMQTIEALGLEPWEVVGVFQTLDMASPGQVEVEDFIQALVKMKTQNEAVDLTTLLNENKRIQKRLTAFMRYTDDHFSEILTCLGTYDAPGSRPRSLSCYLPEWRDDD